MQDYIGKIVLCLKRNLPNGWIPCDGRILSASQYPDIFAKIGTAFGSKGNGTFALPDLRGRMIVGMGTLTSSNRNLNTYISGCCLSNDFKIKLRNDNNTNLSLIDSDEGVHKTYTFLNYIICVDSKIAKENNN